jgi:hypothetical protein
MHCGKRVQKQGAFSEIIGNLSPLLRNAVFSALLAPARRRSVHISAKAMVESRLTSARRESNLVCCTTIGMVDSNTDE